VRDKKRRQQDHRLLFLTNLAFPKYTVPYSLTMISDDLTTIPSDFAVILHTNADSRTRTFDVEDIVTVVISKLLH
jgi:hypothetical protein